MSFIRIYSTLEIIKKIKEKEKILIMMIYKSNQYSHFNLIGPSSVYEKIKYMLAKNFL